MKNSIHSTHFVLNVYKKMEILNGKKANHTLSKSILLIYSSFIALFAIALFLYGFFPMKNYDNSIATFANVPDNIDTIRIEKNVLYKPMIKRIVIMVIDALRWDFVAGPIGKIAMPITNSFIINNSACLLQTKVNAPTVTMPRIKALTTGTVPNFVDVALNFGGKPVTGDSVLLQAKKNLHKLIFYGDDTWIKLFPDLFDRYDGTSSFFVTDYTEVDHNVTRHIQAELSNNDWSIMILHYLGLDHIGHTQGPSSPLIKIKLMEMDDIIGRISTEIANWNRKDISSLFIVCGDHGMKDSGGHGGATPEETLVPLITIGASCPSTNDHINKIDQVDIATTLAIMLGIPIPTSNIGSVSLKMMNKLSDPRKLYLLYYNSLQVLNHFKNVGDYTSRKPYKQLQNAIALHVEWLNSPAKSSESIEKIILQYYGALKGMKDILTNSMIKYDIHLMTVGIFLMYQILYILINRQENPAATPKKILFLIFFNTVSWLSTNYVLDAKDNTVLYLKELSSIILTLFIIVIFLNNCYFCAKRKCDVQSIRKLAQNGTSQWIFSLATLIHALSLSSSSFVEEEHQTWYFFWVTFLAVLLMISIKNLITHWSSCTHESQCQFVQVFVKLFLVLLVSRILRKLNSTGDKYAHLPDISDWLQQQETNTSMTVVLISSLILLIWLGYVSEEEQHKKKSLIFNTVLGICIYLRQMTNDAVWKIPLYPPSRGIYEVQIFWIVMASFLVDGALRLFHTVKYRKRNFLSLLLYLVIQTFVIISAMLHRPHNVVLLPIQLIFSSLMHKVLKTYRMHNALTYIHCWLGNVFYFYQGNSNSLASIDVAAGYAGLESYRPFITGGFLIINTYSAPILAYLTLLYGVAIEKPTSACKTMLPINRTLTILRLLPMAVYTIVVSIQRYHLFVWTVFSPKLLYEAMHCAVMFSLMFFMQTIFFLHDSINKL